MKNGCSERKRQALLQARAFLSSSVNEGDNISVFLFMRLCPDFTSPERLPLALACVALKTEDICNRDKLRKRESKTEVELV